MKTVVRAQLVVAPAVLAAGGRTGGKTAGATKGVFKGVGTVL
jgi:hypothetical protein